jgi:hypothetical protein
VLMVGWAKTFSLRVAICQTLPQRSCTIPRRSPYGVSLGSSSAWAPACSARRWWRPRPRRRGRGRQPSPPAAQRC